MCPRTENFMFVLSQEAHISLVGREKRAARPTGKLLSSSVPGGWVSMAKQEGEVRLTPQISKMPLVVHLTLSSSWWERWYQVA